MNVTLDEVLTKRCNAGECAICGDDGPLPSGPEWGCDCEPCPLCNGEACVLCCAGITHFTGHAEPCEHDVIERHERGPATVRAASEAARAAVRAGFVR